MLSQYFNGGMTAKMMKATYRDLALKFHPDVNKADDATEVMKRINAEFAFWYAHAATDEVKQEKTANNPKAANYYRDTYDSFFAKDLEEAINWMLNHGIYTREDLHAEIIGVFIWISGEAIRNEPDTRATLKASNFRWQNQKKAWFFTPTSTAGYKATNTNLDELRRKYGSEDINPRYNQIG
jgi:curved DNA-binding protein CbpA